MARYANRLSGQAQTLVPAGSTPARATVRRTRGRAPQREHTNGCIRRKSDVGSTPTLLHLTHGGVRYRSRNLCGSLSFDRHGSSGSVRPDTSSVQEPGGDAGSATRPAPDVLSLQTLVSYARDDGSTPSRPIRLGGSSTVERSFVNARATCAGLDCPSPVPRGPADAGRATWPAPNGVSATNTRLLIERLRVRLPPGSIDGPVAQRQSASFNRSFDLCGPGFLSTTRLRRGPGGHAGRAT